MAGSNIPPTGLQVKKGRSGSDSYSVGRPEEAQVDEIDPELERRVVRKIDRVLVPLVTALCEQHSRLWGGSSG